jgi:hypothetical protein
LKAIEGVGTKIHGLLMPPGAQEALSPGTQSIPTVQDPNSTVLGTLKGMVTGSGSAIKQNVMDQINMPSHIYRMLHDVEARHGPIGLLEAAIPTVAGAVIGGLLMHNPEAGAEAGASLAGEGAVAATDAAATEGEIGGAASIAGQATQDLSSAQKLGQGIRSVAGPVTRAVTAPIVYPARAIQAVATSPISLGANLGTQGSAPFAAFQDSWERTQNGATYVDPNTRLPVSFGRDVTSDLAKIPGLESLKMGTGLHNDLSGALDALFMIAQPDTFGAAGRVAGRLHSSEGVGGILQKYFPGLAAKTPEDVANIYNSYAGVRDAVHAMAGMDAAEIGIRFKPFGQIAPLLGKAKTPDEVLQVFEDIARTQELTSTITMPSLSAYGNLKRMAGSKSGIAAQMPEVLDTKFNSLSDRAFPIGDPSSVSAIGDWFRAAGENDAVVRQIMNDLYGSADPKVWATTLNQATNLGLGRLVQKYLGHIPELSDALKQSIENASQNYWGGDGAGFAGIFGNNQLGSDLSRVVTNPGDANPISRSAGIWFNQAGKGAFPSVRDFQESALQLADMYQKTVESSATLAKNSLRDWLDEYVIQKYFKPLALATGSWATRVSSADALLNILRFGPMNFTEAQIASAVGRAGFKIDNNEMGHVQSAIRWLLGHTLSHAGVTINPEGSMTYVGSVVRGAIAGTGEGILKNLGAQELLDNAAYLTMMHDGHIVSPGVSSQHTLPIKESDQVTNEERKFGAMDARWEMKNVTLADEFHQVLPGQEGYFRSLYEHAGRISDDKLGQVVSNAYKDALDSGKSEAIASGDAIRTTREYLDSLPENQITYMQRHYLSSAGATGSKHEDWATQALSALKGTVYGQDGTFHDALLAQIADGSIARKEVPFRDFTGGFKGSDPINLPYTSARKVAPSRSAILQKLAALGHRKLFGPIVNELARNPTYLLEYSRERKLLQPAVEAGNIAADQASLVAENRATTSMIRFVHNPRDRTALENSVRVIAPFYFAQNQSIRRALRLLGSNPGAFEQYLKISLGAESVATRVNQQNGSTAVVVPGAILGSVMGYVGHLVGLPITGSIPVSLSGYVDPLRTVVPFAPDAASNASIGPAGILRPSWGPLAALPLEGFQALAAHSKPLSSAAQKLLGPQASLAPIWTQLLPNSLADHIAEGVAGMKGSSALGTSYASARLMVMQAVASKMTGVQLRSMESNPIQMTDFLSRVNNLTAVYWGLRTIAGFVSPVPIGTTLSQSGIQLEKKLQADITRLGVSAGTDAFITANPDALAYTTYKTSSTGSSYPETAAALQFLTQNKTTVDKWPLSAVYLMPASASKGPFDYAAYNAELAQSLRTRDTPQQFLNQLYINAGNYVYATIVKPQYEKDLATVGASQAYTNREKTINLYGQANNPIWLNYWNQYSYSTNAQESLLQMRQMLTDPSVPKDAHTQNLQSLVDAYDQLQGYKASGYSSSQLKSMWAQAMTNAENQHPDLQPAIQNLFQGLG